MARCDVTYLHMRQLLFRQLYAVLIGGWLPAVLLLLLPLHLRRRRRLRLGGLAHSARCLRRGFRAAGCLRILLLSRLLRLWRSAARCGPVSILLGFRIAAKPVQRAAISQLCITYWTYESWRGDNASQTVAARLLCIVDGAAAAVAQGVSTFFADELIFVGPHDTPMQSVLGHWPRVLDPECRTGKDESTVRCIHHCPTDYSSRRRLDQASALSRSQGFLGLCEPFASTLVSAHNSTTALLGMQPDAAPLPRVLDVQRFVAAREPEVSTCCRSYCAHGWACASQATLRSMQSARSLAILPPLILSCSLHSTDIALLLKPYSGRPDVVLKVQRLRCRSAGSRRRRSATRASHGARRRCRGTSAGVRPATTATATAAAPMSRSSRCAML